MNAIDWILAILYGVIGGAITELIFWLYRRHKTKQKTKPQDFADGAANDGTTSGGNPQSGKQPVQDADFEEKK